MPCQCWNTSLSNHFFFTSVCIGAAGKSTLMNNMFGTQFVEMDAFKGRYGSRPKSTTPAHRDILRGRSQTTQGIWLSKAAGIEPCTLVCDIEGTDGRERGEVGKGLILHLTLPLFHPH